MTAADEYLRDHPGALDAARSRRARTVVQAEQLCALLDDAVKIAREMPAECFPYYLGEIASLAALPRRIRRMASLWDNPTETGIRNDAAFGAFREPGEDLGPFEPVEGRQADGTIRPSIADVRRREGTAVTDPVPNPIRVDGEGRVVQGVHRAVAAEAAGLDWRRYAEPGRYLYPDYVDAPEPEET